MQEHIMSNTPKSPDKQNEHPADGRPTVIGGQDDAYATESNPEGLRYGEKPHKPGELPHPSGEHNKHHDEPPLSVGDE
jgi:hypothetical protein